MSLERQGPGREVARLCAQNLHPISALSEPGSGLGKHYSKPTWLLPGLGMPSVNPRPPATAPWSVPTPSPVHPSHSTPAHRPPGPGAHSLGGSVRLGGVLSGAVVRGAAGSLEGHGAECTFVENLAVSLLDVAFQQGQGQVDDPTVDAPG